MRREFARFEVDAARTLNRWERRKIETEEKLEIVTRALLLSEGTGKC